MKKIFGKCMFSGGVKILAFLLAVLTAVVWYLTDSKKQPEHGQNLEVLSSQDEKTVENPSFRGVWISYVEFGQMIKDKSEEEFKASVGQCLNNIKNLGLDTVILHVRAHCDAFYPSQLFPWAEQTLGSDGTPPGYDPFEIFLSTAHSMNIAVHAWLNPYRVESGSASFDTLPQSSPAKAFNADTQEIVKLDSGIFLNPASDNARQLVMNGVREIIENYDVDGIQFDDYFYPTNDESFDNKLYDEYKASITDGGARELPDWRRQQVNMLMSGVYSIVKASVKSAVFGISPAASAEKNYNEYYADVALWASGGYCDYICPQIYFGFEYPQESSRFDVVLDSWKKMCNEKVRLITGLAAYKIGKEDNKSTEWKDKNDILVRQTESALPSGGVCYYSYSYLFSDDAANTAEREKLLSVLKNN